MRTVTQLSTLFAAPLALALTVGCNQPTPEEYDDVASGISALVADNPGSETNAIEDGIDAAQGDVPSGLSQNGSGQWSGQRAQLDYSYSVTCQDAGGATLSPCADATDSARLVLDIQGSIDTARFDASLSRTGDWTVTGLTQETATLDGFGTFDVESEFMALFRNETRTFKLDYDAAYTGVQIRTSDRRPIGGTVSYEIKAERTRSRAFRDVERSFEVSAELTFAADGTATLVLDGSRKYSVELASGTVTLTE